MHFKVCGQAKVPCLAAKENFLDDADSGLDTTFQQLAFHIERFSGVVLLLVTSDDVFRLQLLPQAGPD